jgi:hypothetical protein
MEWCSDFSAEIIGAGRVTWGKIKKIGPQKVNCVFVANSVFSG